MSVKILVCDPIDAEGVQKLRDEGFEVVTKPSIVKDELEKIIPEYDALVVRSRTKVSRDIIERGKRLKAIARAGAGLDNIALEAAEKKSIT
ncbi:MAG: phosphoglycerate dehydrogenase, partial [Candidatus Bathyarchaeota archaeon]|nr:phosphoglycerate dehydrogenase [Candidatus Bathyarchaeota archaeon]